MIRRGARTLGNGDEGASRLLSRCLAGCGVALATSTVEAERVRAEPFAALEIDLSLLWPR